MLLPGPCQASGALSEHLQASIASGVVEQPTTIHLHARRALQTFYTRRDFAPVWWSDGDLRPVARAFLHEIADSETHGLDPGDYHLAYLDNTLHTQARHVSPALQAGIEASLTDAWFLLAGHYHSGKVDPERIDADWTPSRRTIDIVERFQHAVEADDIIGVIRELPPADPGYQRLRTLLAQLRTQADDGDTPPPVPTGPDLRRGDSGARVQALRTRLLPATPGDPADAYFDVTLDAAVRDFQAGNGLDSDGIVGPATLHMLNLSTADKVEQVRANLERLRWMPDDPGARHVRINIADFSLTVHEGDAIVERMKVIVGRSYRRTPVFSDAIRYLVFNPDWEVPPMIAYRDKLPLLRKNPAGLAAKGFIALDGEQEIDVREIDWHGRKGVAPYRLRQRAGPGNALGRVKIMFPNKYNVYLHDTSDPQLFDKGVRTFSSGCIRVANPLGLSAWLLQETGNWDLPAVQAAIGRNTTQTVRLARPVPVHLQYLTAWVDNEGNAHYRNDIYQRDQAVLTALRATRGGLPGT